jgi:hypothetical protein
MLSFVASASQRVPGDLKPPSIILGIDLRDPVREGDRVSDGLQDLHILIVRPVPPVGTPDGT